MTECPHCRAREGEDHGPNCAIAKKKNLARKDPPKAPLHVGAVVQYFDEPLRKSRTPGRPLAAVCAYVRQNEDDEPTILRIIGVDPIMDDKIIADPDDSQWRWPVA